MKIPRFLFPALFSVVFMPVGLSAAQKSRVDPEALAWLKRMSTSLADARSFTFASRAIVEVPAETGQFLTFFSTADVALQRPDKLSARLRGEAPCFDFYYDGATVAAFAPGNKVYSRTKSPSTIDGMLSGLEEETGIRFATAPLLFSNPYEALTRGITSAVVVGPVVVNGVPCEHLAFRAPGVNWEIWVESNARALPRRIAATFTDRVNFPRTIVEFSRWNLHPWLSSGKFNFRPPAGTSEIPFRSVLKSAGR